MLSPTLAAVAVAVGLLTDPMPASLPGAPAHYCELAAPEANEYLWELYVVTEKRDRYGDFTWKDMYAAMQAGKSLRGYVIDGVHPTFQHKASRLLWAAWLAGHKPGVTSGFRGDPRQDMAEGKKSRTGYSFHGGSHRGGYGNGEALDVVSRAGTTDAERHAANRRLWAWIDINGPRFGIVRIYGDHDGPHIGPMGGSEHQLVLAKVAKRIAYAKLKAKQRLAKLKAKGKYAAKKGSKAKYRVAYAKKKHKKRLRVAYR